MSRRVVWIQLLIGWLPAWGLFTMLIRTAHGISASAAAVIAFRSVIAAALLGVIVQRLAERYPWQRPMRVGFVAMHLLFAAVYAVGWVTLNSAMESALHRRLVLNVGYSLIPTLLTGVWLYVMIAGVSYTAFATERAARSDAIAARAQLAALRSQLHPHFLFNALHSVVQLIPKQPARAAQAAEQLAALLRGTIEDDRDLVPAVDELAFVERYLELERMRFGDRLRVSVQLTEPAKDAMIPLFALQTLVENAVRHGAAPNVEPTEITITGTIANGHATYTVRDTGAGASAQAMAQTSGTGLARLRERLAVLYGRDATLDIDGDSGKGFSATLVVPFADEPS